MVKNKQKLILGHLRSDARKSFSDISRATGIPVTTVFDNYKKCLDQKIISKHTSFIDFKRLGFFSRNFVFVKARDKKGLLEFLSNNPNVNSVFSVDKYDYLAEVVFPGIKEYYDFLDCLHDFEILKLETHDLVEDVKTEGFLGSGVV